MKSDVSAYTWVIFCISLLHKVESYMARRESDKSIHLYSLWHKVHESSGNKSKINSISMIKIITLVNYKRKNEKMKRQATHSSNHENVIIINRNSFVDRPYSYLKSRYTNLAWQRSINNRMSQSYRYKRDTNMYAGNSNSIYMLL